MTILCPQCSGTRVVEDSEQYYQSSGWSVPCPVCDGEKLLKLAAMTASIAASTEAGIPAICALPR